MRLFKDKRYLIILVFICGMINTSLDFNSNTGTLNATEWEPCEPDCPQDSFETGGLYSYSFMLGGCEFEVNYYYRYACDIWCDFNIYQVQLKDSMCINTYTVDFLLDYAMTQLIQFAPEGNCDLPGANDCTTSYRVNNAGCMYRTTPTPIYLPSGEVPPNFSWQTIFPCNGSTCCFKLFSVCGDQYGNITIVPISSTSSGVCPRIDPVGGTCYDTCD